MNNLKINSQIRNRLLQKNISLGDGLSFLICLYYGLKPTFIPSDLEKKVFASGIITKDYTSNSYVWKIPLFEEQENGFEWIGEWMDLFKKVNPERRGTKSYVLKRMKDFFVNNPSVRKEDVFKATNKYLSTVSNPTYCKKSHKFIYEADGSSMLEDFVTRTKEIEKDDSYLENLI